MAGGGSGSSRRRRSSKSKTKAAAAAAADSEATNPRILSSFNCCDRTFCSSDQNYHKRISESKLVPDDKAMEKLPQDISSDKTNDIPSSEEESSRDRRQVLPKGLLVNKYCRICRGSVGHWTVHCPKQDKAKQMLPKKVSDAAENLVLKVSDDIPYCGEDTIAGAGVPSSRPNEPKPKPNFYSETMARLAMDKLNLVPEVSEISDDVPYPGSRIRQPEGPVTLSQLIEIRDALEKENCRNWQILTKKEDTCFMCGLKMGKDCIHFDEDGVFQVPDCAYCGTIGGDHWSHDCPKYSNETFWAAYQELGRIPWGLYKETETKKDTV